MEKIIFLLVFTLLLNGCATKKRTMIYSAIGGSILGGILGKSLSPDKESDLFNATVGAAAGAATAAGISYLLYQDADVYQDLEQAPLQNEKMLDPIVDQTFGMDQIRLFPKITPVGEKEYLNLGGDYSTEVKEVARRQYVKRFKTQAYSFEEKGVKYFIPSFEFISNGVE